MPAALACLGLGLAWAYEADYFAMFFAVAAEETNLKTDYLLQGQNGTVVLGEPGVYQYRDTLHPNVASLLGTIEVAK